MPEDRCWLREFAAPPPLSRSYLRALLAARKSRTCSRLPPLTARVRGVSVQAAHVARFRQALDLPGVGPVPPTYAHLLAFPLHLSVLTDPDFPLRVMGTVHLRNPIRQYRALRPGEKVDIEVRLEGPREVPQGIEHDLVTEVREAGGALVWAGISTNLLRGTQAAVRPGPGTGQTSAGAGAPAWEREWTLWLPAGTGRAYAALSGDCNPIHLTMVTARLFGFRRAIAHGMFTYAQALARLEAHLPEGAMQADIRFRRPLYLPGRPLLRALRVNGQDCWRWSLQDARGQVIHAEGEAGPLPAEAQCAGRVSGSAEVQ